MKKRRDRKERRYLQEQMSFFVFKNRKGFYRINRFLVDRNVCWKRTFKTV
jgi:hypothetical protein